MILRLFLSILISFQSTTYANGVACTDKVSDEGKSFVHAMKEWRRGERAWADYICLQCKGIDSMKPDFGEARICDSCGKPHTGETYFEPAQFEINGKVYLINSRNFADNTDPNNPVFKENWNCPYCNTTTVAGRDDCTQCGGHVVGADRVRDGFKKGFNPTPNLSQSAVAATAGSVYNSQLPKSVVDNDIGALNRRHGILASMVIGVVLSGTVYYFHETHVSPGVVSSTKGNEVVVKFKKGNKQDQMTFTLPSGRVPVRHGENVAVHWNQRYGAFAVMRENSDYAVRDVKAKE